MSRLQPSIRYTIRPARPEAHLFEVCCEIATPAPEGQRLSLPAWIPGSYMIREFARHIVAIRAECGGKEVALEKIDKHTWQVGCVTPGAPLTVRYEVYAWDLSVRAAHLDASHGFFNGTSVFLAVAGQTSASCLVDIQAPVGTEYRNWKVATALPPARGLKGCAKPHGFGLRIAGSYDELIDHPVEMGSFSLGSFEAGGVPHEIALTGRHDCDLDRLCSDLQRICAWQIELFGAPAPMDYYIFLTMVVGEGYGGLEHRASTALLASRKDLPWRGMTGLSEGYKGFLGLCSHEYFHTWNIKRIKPAEFIPYELDRENYTRLLWLFEGFTSYYDDLTLVRCGLIDHPTYLDLLGKNVTNVLKGPGRSRQSVAASSFDAWIKYYRQDENSPNAIVSYYAKGALIALALDLQLRKLTQGARSLDDFMRALWHRHGQGDQGVSEAEVYAIVTELAGAHGAQLARWLRRAVEGTDDLALASLLKPFGVDYAVTAGSKTPALGVKLAAGNGDARLATVYEGGAAQRAGLSAGDVLIAIDGLKVGAGTIDELLVRRSPGAVIEIHAFRRDELMRVELTLDAPAPDTAKLTLAPRATANARSLREGWLGRPAPADAGQ